jgi:cyclic-di-AMP phosphodiesterase PgpH
MATTLVNLYHGRIKYPWQRDKQDAEKTPIVHGGPAAPTVVHSPAELPEPKSSKDGPKSGETKPATTEETAS